MPTERTLPELCKINGLRIRNRYGAPESDTFKDSHGWTCTLLYQGRRLTTSFYQGYGFKGAEPKPEDVISSLLSDMNTGAEDGNTFENWAADLGYDPDSRSAERVFKACLRIAPKVRRLLGDDLEAFQEAASNY